MFEGIKKYFRDIREIERYKSESYNAGYDDATAEAVRHITKLTDQMGELTDRYTASEKRTRTVSDERIKDLEDLHTRQCDECRRNLEDERQRLRRRQSVLAEKIDVVDDLMSRLMNHAGVIVNEHDSILRSSGRIVAHRDVLLQFQQEASTIMRDAKPLLSLEITDSSEDKVVDIHEINSKSG